MTKLIITEEKCPRCGSARAISRTWKEKIETTAGVTEIENIQTVCTNAECQEKFDKNRAQEVKRQDEIKFQKEERDTARKNNAFAQAQQARRDKVKI